LSGVVVGCVVAALQVPAASGEWRSRCFGARWDVDCVGLSRAQLSRLCWSLRYGTDRRHAEQLATMASRRRCHTKD